MKIIRFAAQAFSLIEPLVVVGIMLILIGLVVPAFNSVGTASQITSSSQILIAELNRARQEALARNRAVEVRFFTVPPKTDAQNTNRASIRAVQRVVADPTGGVLGAEAESGRLVFLPGSIQISTNSQLSVTNLTTSATTNLPGLTNAPYTAFHFLPNGSANLTNEVFWTITDERDTQVPPNNFATVQLDPRTGRVRLFRP